MAHPDLMSPLNGTNQITTAELLTEAGGANPVVGEVEQAGPSAISGTHPQGQDLPGAQGVEGEEVIWEGRYSMRNFIGRGIARVVAVVAWVGLAVYTFGYHHENLRVLTWIAGGFVLVYTLALLVRMFQAHYSHFYKLTNRRLFVSSGIWRRRRDQMELLRIKDVFTRQLSLFDRWLSLGTVVVVSSEQELPTIYLSGVDDPKVIMDLVWHHARVERDQNSVKVNHV